ncbi:MAG: hypothetical protein WKG01_29585 [Kofleriaceae bacterium]
METNETSEDTTTDTTGAKAPARYTELQTLVAGMAADFDKFYNQNNKAAGTRVRNAMQELKTFAQTVRNEVSQIKNQVKGEGGGTEDAADSSDAAD